MQERGAGTGMGQLYRHHHHHHHRHGLTCHTCLPYFLTTLGQGTSPTAARSACRHHPLGRDFHRCLIGMRTISALWTYGGRLSYASASMRRLGGGCQLIRWLGGKGSARSFNIWCSSVTRGSSACWQCGITFTRLDQLYGNCMVSALALQSLGMVRLSLRSQGRDHLAHIGDWRWLSGASAFTFLPLNVDYHGCTAL